MKPVVKWSVRLGLALTTLLLLVPLATLTRVDQTPFRDLPAWQDTAARLLELRAGTNVVFGELRAGFGRARLTPALGAEQDEPDQGRFRAVPLAGYGARQGRPATGVHQELWVKAVAFAVAGQTGVMVSADALIIPREVADLAARQVREARGVTREAVYLSATHTHSSLGGWGEGFVAEAFAGGFVAGVREWYAGQLAAAAIAALDDLSPASCGQGGFEAPEYVRNRLLGEDAPKDPDFRLLYVQQADGDTAVLGSYAAHSTVLPAANLEFSGDYPGYWSLAVERATGGLALFLAGGMGSHGPRAGAPGFAGAQRMGEALATRTAEALTNLVLTNRLTFGLAAAEATLPALQVRVSNGVRLRPWVARGLLSVPATTWIQGLRVGNALWFSTPCDFSGELALGVKVAAREQGLAAAVTSFNGDYVGYVIPAKYYPLAGYEPRTMSFFGPQLPDQFMAVLGELTAVLADR
ncbi:MAG: neutral/alkaline non-lysosomal ceramidase N-terminal domain-containing protein [Verrucomicrobiales bacterium]|nr:neutral/alkaline non-lysosomal ceramidase N-terminal domain-containing protein [Verrucomicrobiales bacterium]